MNPQPNRAQQLALRAFLKEFSRSHNRAMLASIMCGFGNGLLMIASCYVLAKICHQVMFANAELNSQVGPLAMLSALIVGRSLLTYASRYLGEHSGQRIKQQMRAALWQALVKQQQLGVQARSAAELTMTLNQGVEALHDYFAKYLPAVAYAGLIPIAIIAVVIPIDWQSGLIFIVTAPLIPFFMILIGYKAQELNERNWQKLQRMGQFFFDRLMGLAQLRLFNSADRQVVEVEKMADQFRLSTMSVLRIAFISTLALEFLATISIALVAVIIGFRLYFGTLDFATGFVVLLLAPEFYLPLRQLGVHYHAKLKGLASADSMMAILHTDIEGYQQPSDAEMLEQINTLSIDNLYFGFGHGDPVLRDINVHCPRTGMVAIVGPSGAGKSTLMDCLMGVYPQAYEHIKVNGLALSQYDITHYQQHIAWVAQEPTLFSGSIASNITLGQHVESMDRIRHVCAQVDMDEFIMSLPHGYDTLIGELGAGLSGGQVQRLAIARSLYKSPRVLFLDEPTAALDKHSERVVQQCLKTLSKNMLIVVIAHRLHTLNDAQQLLILKEGELIEVGSYEKLSNEPTSHFYSMLNHSGVTYG